MSQFALIALAVLLLAVSSTFAQTTQPTTMPGSSDAAVKAAAREFMMALDDKDLAVARKLFAGTDQDFKIVELLHEKFQASQRLQTAAEARWPEEMKKRAVVDTNAKTMAANVDHQAVSFHGDVAVLKDGAALKNIDGRWQVVDVMSNPVDKGLVLGIFPSLSPVTSDVATAVQAGKYGSFDEAHKDLQKKVQAAVRARMKAATQATTNPTTKPAE